MASSSSAPSPASWSELPLDLLISIRDLLLGRQSDLLSFRSVCSHWRSVVPAPAPLRRYLVSLSDGVVSLDYKNEILRSIPLPFPSSDELTFFCSSNGWLVFRAPNESVHLFDPVTHRKHSLPLLTRKTFRSADPRCWVYLYKVVVSASAGNGVAVAGLAYYQTGGLVTDERLVFYRPGKDKIWKLYRESSRGILDVVLSSCGRWVYAIGRGWELFVVEAGPPMRSKRFNLWLPKQILYDPELITKRLPLTCNLMRNTAGGYLIVYGLCKDYRSGGCWIDLKVETAKLRVDSRDVDVVCEAKWGLHSKPGDKLDHYLFTPIVSVLGQASCEGQGRQRRM